MITAVIRALGTDVLAVQEILAPDGDTAAALPGADWHPTAGHHPADVYGAHGVRRRIDGVRVTGSLAAAVRAHQVLDTAQTRAASDHLPVTVEYLPRALHA